MKGSGGGYEMYLEKSTDLEVCRRMEHLEFQVATKMTSTVGSMSLVKGGGVRACTGSK